MGILINNDTNVYIHKVFSTIAMLAFLHLHQHGHRKDLFLVY